MERMRQVIAIITAILLIIISILFARWVGDRLRERFLVPKVPAAKTAPPTTPSLIFEDKPIPNILNDKTTPTTPTLAKKTATYSAIPKTGPEDFGYFILGLLFLSGLSLSVLARRSR